MRRVARVSGTHVEFGLGLVEYPGDGEVAARIGGVGHEHPLVRSEIQLRGLPVQGSVRHRLQGGVLHRQRLDHLLGGNHRAHQPAAIYGERPCAAIRSAGEQVERPASGAQPAEQRDLSELSGVDRRRQVEYSAVVEFPHRHALIERQHEE